MPLLICLVGLPRSGKSTWAKTGGEGNPIVSPDAIRLALHGRRFIPESEPFVWAIAKTMVRALFLAGHRVVVLDATNITKRRRDEWQAPEWVTRFKVIDTPKDVCITRAITEHDDYIISVIERQAAEWDPPTEDLL